MSPRPSAELSSLDDAINNFQQVATILKGQSLPGQQKKPPKPLDRYHDLKSLSYFLKLPPISTPNSPPPIPPPPIPPPPINYSPSPPPPPIRAHIPLKLSQPPPPPPPRTDQPKVAIKRIQQSGADHMREKANPDTNNKEKKRLSCTGLAVENLDTLLADMETFNSGPLGKNLNSGRKIKIEIETDDNLEKKLDNLTDKLLTAFDAKSDVKSKDSKEEDELGVCSKCQLVIRESAILAGSSTYHQNCFTCTHCGKRLGSKFFCVDNDPYCEEHKEVSLDRCEKCGDCIREGAVLVNGASYHPHCFSCSACGMVIDKKFFTTEDKKFLCGHCYHQTRDKCSHCGLPILERLLTAMDKKFHPVCFRCALCDAPLDGVPFLLSGSSINCKPCYTKYKAAPCARCGEGIVSTGTKKTTLITCNGQSFHQNCYTCQDCSQNLCGEFVCCDKSDIICFTCDVKRRN